MPHDTSPYRNRRHRRIDILFRVRRRDEVRLELRRREEDAAVQHLVEEPAVARAIRGDRVLLEPAAAGELVEVGARVGGAVERARLEADLLERDRDGAVGRGGRVLLGAATPAAACDEEAGAGGQEQTSTGHEGGD